MAIQVVKDEIGERIDELADLCECWKRSRAAGRSTPILRSAVIMAAHELNSSVVDAGGFPVNVTASQAMEMLRKEIAT